MSLGAPKWMPVFSLRFHQLWLFAQKHTMAPIAEAFAIIALFRKAREQGAKFVFNVRIFNRVLPDAIKARARGVATKPELIAARRFADESNFRHVWPRA